jgi:hypothetical protein
MLVIAFDVWNAIRKSTRNLQLFSGESWYTECINTSVNRILTGFSHLTIIVIVHKQVGVSRKKAFGEFKALWVTRV